MAERGLTDIGNLPAQLSRSTRAALIRIAHRVAQGFYGEVTLVVDKQGGVREVRWFHREEGDTIREELGI